MRGECKDKFNYTSVANCSKYDGIGYCSECDANFTLYNKECVPNCVENSTCSTLRDLSRCDPDTLHCSECLSDEDCSLTGYGTCISGRCELCANDTMCAAINTSLPFCYLFDFSCNECFMNSHCENNTASNKTICNLANKTCIEGCPSDYRAV